MTTSVNRRVSRPAKRGRAQTRKAKGARVDGRCVSDGEMEGIRLVAVRRVVEGGEKPSAVMKSYGLCRTTIYPWLRTFRAEGLEALRTVRPSGPAPTVEPLSLIGLRRQLLNSGLYQLEGQSRTDVWTAEHFTAMAETLLGQRLSIAMAKKLLRSFGFTGGRPMRSYLRRHSGESALWLRQEFPAIVRQARAEGRECYLISMGCCSPRLQRTAAAVREVNPDCDCSGTEPALVATRLDGGFVCLPIEVGIEESEIIRLLEYLLKHRSEKLLVVIGTHPFTSGRRFVAWHKRHQKRLVLCYLPPWAPQLDGGLLPRGWRKLQAPTRGRPRKRGYEHSGQSLPV